MAKFNKRRGGYNIASVFNVSKKSMVIRIAVTLTTTLIPSARSELKAGVDSICLFIKKKQRRRFEEYLLQNDFYEQSKKEID